MAALDANVVEGATAQVSAQGRRRAAIFVTASSGSHNNHTINVQVSAGGGVWLDTSYAVTGLGYKDFPLCAAFVRAAVVRPEGDPSVVNVDFVLV